MKLHFAYNIEKDIENFINGTRAVNSKKPTKFQTSFSEKYGDNFEKEKVKIFIEEQDKINGFDANKEIVAVEERWKIAKPIFIERVEKIFGISYPVPIITVYLTHNERCTYNIEQDYFFVRIGSEFSNNTIMHELLHFYTWHAFGKKLLDEGLSKLAYNDVKESLTELLNLEFSDLLNGKRDEGYPQNQVSEAISQLRIKEAVSPPMEAPQEEQYAPQDAQGQAPQTPVAQQYSQQQYQGQYDYSQQGNVGGQGYYQDYYQPSSGGMSSDTMSEIAEQVMAEKFSSIKDQLEKVIDYKNTVTSRIDIIDERLKRIEKIIDRLQLSILQKVGDYLTNVDEIKKELVETQKSFKSALSKSGSSNSNMGSSSSPAVSSSSQRFSPPSTPPFEKPE